MALASAGVPCPDFVAATVGAACGTLVGAAGCVACCALLLEARAPKLQANNASVDTVKK